MAIVSRMVSDISGKEANEDQFVQLTIREHPEIQEPKALDVLPEEIANMKDAGNLVVVEVGSNGDRKQMIVSLTEFRKHVPDDVVKNARGTRGRRPGWSPKS